MEITFGKHKGKSTELVFFESPDYVNWILSKSQAKGQMAMVYNDILRLIKKFDSANFTVNCHTEQCNKIATYCTIHRRNSNMINWWCDDCEPYQLKSTPGMLEVIRNFGDALNYVNNNSGNNDLTSLIQQLARAKGLPEDIDENEAQAFFI
jgi:hypothetical protein